MREYRYTNPVFSDISYPLTAACFPKGARCYLSKRGLFSLNLPIHQCSKTGTVFAHILAFIVSRLFEFINNLYFCLLRLSFVIIFKKIYEASTLL